MPLFLRNDGAGAGFQASTFAAAAFVATSLAVGDVDGDALPDVVFGEAGAAAAAAARVPQSGCGQFLLNRTILNGTILNGTILNGTILNGTILNGTIRLSVR